jgi:F-type H+-transporting ATPase subunit c
MAKRLSVGNAFPIRTIDPFVPSSQFPTLAGRLSGTSFRKELDPVMIRSLYSTRSLAVVAACVATVLCADIASAQEAAASGRALIDLTSAFSVGLVVIGAAYGISKLASAAYEGMSRQPEVAGSIQTAMIIAAALIEGFTFYALFICSQKA